MMKLLYVLPDKAQKGKAPPQFDRSISYPVPIYCPPMISRVWDLFACYSVNYEEFCKYAFGVMVYKDRSASDLETYKRAFNSV